MNTEILLHILLGDDYYDERISDSRRIVQQPSDPAPLDPGDVGELASATDAGFYGDGVIEGE